MRLRRNNFKGVLGGSGLSSSGTTITFAAAPTYRNGAALPTVTAPDYMPLVLVDSTNGTWEIVYMTAYTTGGTTGAIVRARENSTGISHNAGDRVLHGLTSLDTPRDLVYHAPAGQMVIDEFNDASIDSAFIQVDDPSGGAARVEWIEQGDSLYAKALGGDATGEMHALMLPLTNFGGAMAIGDAIVARLNVQQPVTATFTMAGILLADGVTYGSGNQAAAFAYFNSGYAVCSPYTGYNTYNSLNQTNGMGFFAANLPFWIRLVKTGTNTWRTDISPNGVHWYLNMGGDTQTVTPTHVGLWVSSWSTGTVGFVTFDLLRRVSGIS